MNIYFEVLGLGRELGLLRRVALDEVADMFRHRNTFDIAEHADFPGDFLGNVPAPVLQRVEGHNADGLVEPAREEVRNDRVEVGSVDLGLTPGFSKTDIIA